MPTISIPNAMLAVAKNGVTIGSTSAVIAFQSNVGSGLIPMPDRLPVKMASNTELGAIQVILVTCQLTTLHIQISATYQLNTDIA